MSAACLAGDGGDDGIAGGLIGAIDCFVRGDAAASYAHFAGPGSPFALVLGLALTLYVAGLGYRLILGHADLALRALAPRVALMGAVLALTTQWGAWQALVYDVLTDGPADVAGWIDPAAGQTPQLMARVDTVSARLLTVADAWSEAARSAAGADAAPEAQDGDAAPAAEPSDQPGAFAGLPRGGFGPDMLLASGLLLVLASAGVLAVAKALLALLLGVGPLFMAMALFDATRGLAAGWARAAVGLALVPLFATLMTLAALGFLEPMTVALAAQADGEGWSLRTATAILVAVLVLVAVNLQTFRMAQQMLAGWSLFGAGDTAQRAADTPPPAPVPGLAVPVLASAGAGRVDAIVAQIGRGADQGMHGGGGDRGASGALAPRAPAAAIAASVAGGAGSAPSPRRGVDGGRVRPARAPLRAIRSSR